MTVVIIKIILKSQHFICHNDNGVPRISNWQDEITCKKITQTKDSPVKENHELIWPDAYQHFHFQRKTIYCTKSNTQSIFQNWLTLQI